MNERVKVINTGAGHSQEGFIGQGAQLRQGHIRDRLRCLPTKGFAKDTQLGQGQLC